MATPNPGTEPHWCASCDDGTQAGVAGPTVDVFEPDTDATRVWACNDPVYGWVVMDRDECEIQGCSCDHALLTLGARQSAAVEDGADG